ncbi:MAG TPA: diaminopimelate epimerase [Thermodesulfovibrionales bacterium]|jgi:diaminopimelate epimerase|nr:diaminopimelate epimerase [Thermodesulfovibrionales bacterium]
MKLPFTKMEGLGNDFILVDCREFNPPDISALAQKLCHRRFGIGADQLLLLYPSERADFRMVIVNADGSEVEMCGNGIRCFAKYVWDKGLSDKRAIRVETLAGIIIPEQRDSLIRVDMGEPVLEPSKVPVEIPDYQPETLHSGERPMIIDYPLFIDDALFKITCVSMGNPHAVIVVDNVTTFPVAYYGPMIENHHFFPKRTNVEFIEIMSPSEIKMRVWERGAGETMACGTGASAVVVAASLKGLTARSVTVHLMGGDLFIEWSADNRVSMSGPAVEVFTGVFNFETRTES